MPDSTAAARTRHDASPSQSDRRIPENYIPTLFRRFKESHYEQLLIMAFARQLDLITLILTDAVPAGQRKFSESDVRDFIDQFDKKALHISFALAKSGLQSHSREVPALGNYEAALRDLISEVSRSVGERVQTESEEPEGVVAPEPVEDEAPEPSPSPPPSTPPGTLRGRPLSTGYLCLSPLWQAIFPLPVLLGWVGGMPVKPLLGIALVTSVAFVLSHHRPGWVEGILLGVLGNLLNVMVILPIALWDQRQMRFPWLPAVGEMPRWLNACLWGVMCTIGCHALYNMLILTVRSPLGSRLPAWMRHLPLV